VGPGYLLTQPEDLTAYAFDATPLTQPPAAVVRPGSAAEVSAILELANREGIPVVPRGAGTNLSGGAVPVSHGILLVLNRLDRILEIDEANLTATLQAGVILADLHREVESRGLFYPPDPSSLRVATIGGTVAEGAGGPRAVKYGTTKDYVLGLEVVLPTGEIIRTGGKTVKNVSGYNLTQFLVGSEGTLGVVTEVTVRLLPLPEAKRTGLAIFASLEAAAEAVSGIIRRRIIPRTLELMERASIALIEDYCPSGLPREAAAVLLIEVDGSQADVPYQWQRVREACREHGAQEFREAATPEEAEALWAGRRSHYAALARARPSIVIEDVTVPRQAVPAMVRAIREAAARHGIEVGLVAHAGDGNMHPDIIYDARDPEQQRRAQALAGDIFRAALALGGTITGEHGVGLLKAPYLEWQWGREGVAALRRLKRALDPNNILNPGKIFPA